MARALQVRSESGERDYVRAEIAAALKRGISVVPVRVGREGSLPALPPAKALPDDIRDLVLHQKHDVVHERFGRDTAELARIITESRKRSSYDLRYGPKFIIIALMIFLATVGLIALKFQSLLGAYTVLSTERATAKMEGSSPMAEAPVVQSTIQHNAARPPEDKDRTAGEVFRECAECPEMVVVPAGEFLMGSPESEPGRDASEGPQHKVIVAEQFAIGRFEITFDEWDACVKDKLCKEIKDRWGRGRQPVIGVAWPEISQQFLPWLAKRTGKVYRLPTEEEWEYVARAGTTTPFSTGYTITSDQANFDGRSPYNGMASFFRRRTVEVGSFPPNAFGVYDMHGNVWEQLNDCYHNSYASVDRSNSYTWGGDCPQRVWRGGSWDNGARKIRSAFRDRFTDRNLDAQGFRVVRSLAH